MVKKIVAAIFISTALLSFFYFFLKTGKDDIISDPPISPTESPLDTSIKPTFSHQESKQNVQFITVRDTEKIFLYSNLSQKDTSENLKRDNGCLYLTSGGFYTQQDKHIGLFVSEGEKLSDAINSATFNGFFSIDTQGKALISSTKPENIRLAVQTGPVLMKDGKPLNLELTNDESGRRVVVATNRFGHVFFLTFFRQGSVIDGPTLLSLPKLVDDLRKDTQLDFDTAINLDGGSHSTFLTDIISLKELSPIGSYFCIKP